MLIASACGGGDDPAADAAQSPPAVVETSESTDPSQPPLPVIDRSDFCGVARQFASSNPFGDLAAFDASAFAAIDEILTQAEDLAPPEIKDDVRVTRGAFNDFGALLEKYDFNFFDAELQVELEAMSTDALSDAGGRVSDYMRDECEINVGGGGDAQDPSSLPAPSAGDGLVDELSDVEGIDPAIAALMQVLGVDAELAECLSVEFEDFDMDSPDPAMLSKEVCGTTLLEILSSLGSGG